MSDVEALWCQFARHALRKATQSELAYREPGRLRKSLDAGRSACEKHGTVPVGQHMSHRVLGHPEGGNRGDVDSPRNGLCVDLCERAANGPRTRWLAL